MTVRVRAPARARAARDPRRRAAADAARLRRRAPLLRRPAAGRRDRPPASALRLRRRGRAGARLAARARPGGRRDGPAARDRGSARGARRRSPRSRVLWSTADAAAQNLLAVLPAPLRRARRRRRALAVPRLDAARPRRSPPSRSRRCSPLVGAGRGGDAAADLLHARPSRSGTRTRTSSASPRSSATRACTAARSCSRWRSC